MNNDKLHALRVKFPNAALELDLVSGRINPETGLVNPDYEADEMQDLMEYYALEVLDVIDNQGHSGFSYGYLMSLLTPLLNDLPITPLTGREWEWGTMVDKDQNKRCSRVFRDENGNAHNTNGRVFSDDGGKTWFRSRDSRKNISFPCTSEELKPEYIILNSEENADNASKEV